MTKDKKSNIVNPEINKKTQNNLDDERKVRSSDGDDKDSKNNKKFQKE